MDAQKYPDFVFVLRACCKEKMKGKTGADLHADHALRFVN
jgi:hypothetical protein